MNTRRLPHLRIGYVFSVSLAMGVSALAQTATGGVQGTVTDSSGASVQNAAVVYTDESTGETGTATTDNTGLFRILNAKPDRYTVSVEAPGFKRAVFEHITVQLAQVTPLNVTLGTGAVQEQVTVNGDSTVGVDPVSTESGVVINQNQIENLAIVGRNVMDLAQLAPGVQLRDGNDIDATKSNFTVAAFQGRSGRETQVQWDGLSIQDHTVGGPVQNVGLDTIQEFQVAETTLHPAQSVASGGAVNMLSRTGGNSFHGSAFEFFRDSRLGAKQGLVKAPYDRNQLGGRLGGPIQRDKLFFFLDEELNDTRDTFAGQTPFAFLNRNYAKPFRENFAVGRLDAVLNPKWTGFGRYSYSYNHGIVGYPSLGNSLINSISQKTQSNVFGSGANYVGGSWTHSFKYGFNAYSQELIPDPNAPAPVDSLGRKYLLQLDGGSTLAYGPNLLTNQAQKQRNYQGKYDGAKLLGHHSLAFGADLTRWALGADYPLRTNAPELDGQTSDGSGTPGDPGSYKLTSIVLGNGLGYAFNTPGVGFPHGGTSEWRPAGYIHDTWTLSHHLTVNGGVRYVFFSNQFNTNINHGTLLDQFEPGYGGYRHSPKTDFSPQIGGAWDPTGSGKTVVRAAAGIYFEELTFDGFANDSASFIPTGIALSSQYVAGGGTVYDPRTGNAFAAGDPLATQFGFAQGTSGSALAYLFNQTIGQSATAVGNLQALYKAAAAQNAASGTSQTSFDINHQLFNAAFTPGVKNPRVYQINASVQRQLRPGLVFTGEYVNVRGTEFPLILDENHIGEAQLGSFDRNLAIAAISAANGSIAGCPANLAGTTCAIAGGATIATYGQFGLGAGFSTQGYAFRGRNPNFGTMPFYEHKGFNTYNGVNLRLDGRLGQSSREALSWMRSNTLTVAYTVSRNVGDVKSSGTAASDISAYAYAWDNNSPTRVVGPDGLDRTSMLNVGTITDIKGGFIFSQITHWFSPLAQNTLIPVAFSGCSGGPDEIFCSDVNGDGTTNDLLPNVVPGSFGRKLKGASGLNSAIGGYNSNFAGRLTPAGQLLVSQGLFTASQLAAAKGTMPNLPLAPLNEVGLDLLLLTDVRLSWQHRIAERITLEPSWDAFNVFNRTSYDPPGNILNSNLYGTPGSINGTTPETRTNVRQRGSGSFEQGARRQMQAGLRLSF